MHEDYKMEVGASERLEAAGFRLANLEEDRSIIYMLGPDLRILYCNKAWDEFATLNGVIGLNREAVLGKFILELIREPLKALYANGFAQAQYGLRPWEHDSEFSSSELFPHFHVRVLPLANSYLLVENSLIVESTQGSERPEVPSYPTSYLNDDGAFVMCSHCRRTRRINTNEVQIWDWVPEVIMSPAGRVSHGLCRNCRAYLYPHLGITFR